MKKYMVITIALLLVSCAGVGTYNETEYSLAVQAATTARTTIDSCGDPLLVRAGILDLDDATETLYSYTQYTPGNEDMFAIAATLKVNTDELMDSYKQNAEPSVVYCKLKLQILEKTAEQAARTAAAKRRN